MIPTTTVLLSSLATFGLAGSVKHACGALSESDAFSSSSSESAVYWPESSEYELAIEHWLALSTKGPSCVAQPVTASDIGAVVRRVGNQLTGRMLCRNSWRSLARRASHSQSKVADTNPTVDFCLPLASIFLDRNHDS